MQTSRKVWLAVILVLALCIGVYGFSKVNLLKKGTTLKVEVDKYVRAELRTTKLNSRKWMNRAMEIAKHVNFAPPSAARLYSYTASVYSDVLEVSNADEASIATAEILNALVPEEKAATQTFLANLTSKNSLSPESRKIVDSYKKRMTEDKYDLVWDKVTPDDKAKWHVRENKIDKGAKAGEWSTWILNDSDVVTTPPPPVFGSLKDALELEKVQYAVDNRRLEDVNTIYFWHGSTGFEKGVNADNVTPAGVWQNILFLEVYQNNDDVNADKDYAYSQKILAQAIADSFIKCWQVKYSDWTQRPSMRLGSLDTLVADPPFPSYVSGHSTISATAATVLAALYPEKKQIWMDNLTDARNSRLMAGIHFDTDNKMGENLGLQIGKIIVDRVLKVDPSTYSRKFNPVSDGNFLTDTWNLGLLRAQPMAKQLVNKYVSFYRKHIDKPIFENVVSTSGIKMLAPSAGASFTDYDNDEDLDLFVAGRGSSGVLRMYRNDDGKFTDVTREAGLENSRNSLVFSGIFADYNNDGCKDLVMTGDLSYPDKQANTWLYKNDCKGKFVDVTAGSGVINRNYGRGAAWADYDSDGDLDLYIANQGDYEGTTSYSYQPNALFRNNGNGTFTDTTEFAGVNGLIGLECPITRTPTIKISGKGYKASLQPIWFDYNNDNKIDLFVATDSGISPLYMNKGDGKFENVTSEAGMCKYGTGMGVSAADYDNDSDFDIYITNVGGNYLWENQGDGTFVENSKAAGVGDKTSLGWGTGFFDYDNDGNLDLYVVNGDVISGNSRPHIGKVRIDRLYHNQGDKTFESVAEKEGVTGDDPKEGATFGDYDGNGFEDMFVLTGRKDKVAIFRLYKNKGNSNNWITLKLTGTKSNKDAVGAKISVVSGDLVQNRQVISGSSYLSQNSLWQTFGLGKNNKIDEIKITWPSGEVQTLKDVGELNRSMAIVEP